MPLLLARGTTVHVLRSTTVTRAIAGDAATGIWDEPLVSVGVEL